MKRTHSGGINMKTVKIALEIMLCALLLMTCVVWLGVVVGIIVAMSIVSLWGIAVGVWQTHFKKRP
jgi:presenilin-like A22 family membrane protease